MELIERPEKRLAERLAERTEVAVVGAGPAGLAVGACLRKAGLNFVILEKERQLAPAWRKHYERLHLHTVKQHSSLPFLDFPRSYPRYVPKKLMIEYLENYARTFCLQPRFGEAVTSITQDGDDWIVESTSYSLRTSHVVIAAGANTEPFIPAVCGIEKFKGPIIHSADYVNAAPFAGQSVLIIGMGNTGAEIALDLSEGGARPTISVRDGVHVVPRELFGVPIQVVAMLATKLMPAKGNDFMLPIILDATFGDLSKYGLKRPQEGILQRNASSSRVPVIDVGTVSKVSTGAIKIVPGVSRITGNSLIFDDGTEGVFDAIIFATGYRPNYQSLFPAGADPAAKAFDAANTRNSRSRVFFVGYQSALTGVLREISRESRRVAGDILRYKAEPRAASTLRDRQLPSP